MSTPTPETDKAPLVEFYDDEGTQQTSDYVDRNFCRSIERQRDEARNALRAIQDLIWNNPTESACAAYEIADRLLNGTQQHVTAISLLDGQGERTP